MSESPVRSWQKLAIGLAVALMVVAAIVMLSVTRDSRESAAQDRLRSLIRTGQLAPEAGRGFMDDDEIERLKAQRAMPLSPPTTRRLDPN
jgi:hypothetical protein